MIRRIYAAFCAAVAVVAVFGVLAFQQRSLAPTATGTQVVARTASGALVPVTTAPSTVHATTSSSGVPTQSATAGGGTGSAVLYVKNATGSFVPVGKSAAATPAPVAAVTRSS